MTLADNSWRSSGQQNKRLLVVARDEYDFGADGIIEMAAWLRQPIAVLSGDEFNSMPIPPHRDAFAVFYDWLTQRLSEAFCSDGSLCVNGLLMLRGFDAVLEGNGHLATDRFSRARFHSFLKALQDPHSCGSVPIQLAPGHLFPLDLARVHGVITFHRESEGMLDADPCLDSRCLYMPCG